MPLTLATLLQSIRQNKLFPRKSCLLIAVSGGADSLALLHLMANLRSHYPLILHAASLNHGIRPEAAEEQQFVQDSANAWNVSCTLGNIDVPALAKKQNIGLETAARQARYEFLLQVAETTNSEYILTAHHADDQIETMLMHLIRGAGLQGLSGMRMSTPLPLNPNYMIIRPLLPFSRIEIENYCSENSLVPRSDPSNLDTQIQRNALRHEIVPRLRQINPQLGAAFSRLASISQADEAYLQQHFETIYKPLIQFSEQVTIPKQDFLTWHVSMQRRSVLAAYTYFETDAHFDRIEAAIQLAQTAKLGAIAELGAGLNFRIDYQSFIIEKTSATLTPENYLKISHHSQLSIPSEIVVGNFSLIISKERLPDFDLQLAIPHNAIITLRTRRDGDRFKPLGMNGHSRKLKDIFIDRKIPQTIRDTLPLLEVNGELAAILFLAETYLSESFAITDESKEIVYIKVNLL